MMTTQIHQLVRDFADIYPKHAELFVRMAENKPVSEGDRRRASIAYKSFRAGWLAHARVDQCPIGPIQVDGITYGMFSDLFRE